FYVFGRSDGTVSIVGANIFPENIQAILSERSDDAIVTFRLSVSTSDDFSQRLVVDMEHHSEDLLESEAALLSERYRVLLLNGLRRINQDFRDAHDDNPQCADSIVTIHCRRTGPFTTSSGIKNLYIAKT
ncbi:MAG: hypothetical protein Q7U89_01925, partial [Coriobacteriia bacterium]|nr:hypothetical protein [Coriobacteriia bacterium]